MQEVIEKGDAKVRWLDCKHGASRVALIEESIPLHCDYMGMLRQRHPLTREDIAPPSYCSGHIHGISVRAVVATTTASGKPRRR